MGLQNSTGNQLLEGSAIRLGGDAPFDLYYNGLDGTLKRLPVGALGTILKATSNGIEWIANSAELKDGAVTYRYIQDVTSGRLLGRYSPGAGIVEELTPAQIRALLALGTAALLDTGNTSGKVVVVGAGDKIDSALIPAVATREFVRVANTAARLALTTSQVQPGDDAFELDTLRTYRLVDTDPSVSGNWILLSDAQIDATEIASGIFAAARLATGTANANTWLRGDQTWQPLPFVGLTSIEVTGTAQAMSVNSAYRPNNAGLVTLTLPTTASAGNLIRITGVGGGGWRLAQNAGQQVHFGSQSTTAGTGGRIDSTHRRDSLTLECVTQNSEWQVISSVGNFSIT